jgi:hypothetical protein
MDPTVRRAFVEERGVRRRLPRRSERAVGHERGVGQK